MAWIGKPAFEVSDGHCGYLGMLRVSSLVGWGFGWSSLFCSSWILPGKATKMPVLVAVTLVLSQLGDENCHLYLSSYQIQLCLLLSH